MKLQEYIETVLTDISTGINSTNEKLDGLVVKVGEKISFTVAVQAFTESEQGGKASLDVKLLSMGGGKSKTSKNEVHNTVSFDVYFEEIKKDNSTFSKFDLR